MDTHLVFGILGPLEVRAGGTLVHIGGPRQRALLALLLCHANRVVSRDQLIDELLSDQPAESAERMLRVQVSRLRQALSGCDGQARVLTRSPGYQLRVEDGELDLQVFEQRVAAGTGPVTYLGCLLFAADDLVLCLFCGPSRAAVIAASDRLGIPRERLMDSAWLNPHQPSPEGPWQ